MELWGNLLVLIDSQSKGDAGNVESGCIARQPDFIGFHLKVYSPCPIHRRIVSVAPVRDAGPGSPFEFSGGKTPPCQPNPPTTIRRRDRAVMTRIKVSFNARLAADFEPVAANDNGDPRAAICPLDAEDITHEVAKAAIYLLSGLRRPRRLLANQIAHALYEGPYDIRYEDGEYFLAGYEIDNDLSSDWTFTWLKDMYAAANDNGPLPSLTPMTIRRVHLLILWMFVADIDRGERLGLSPCFLRFDKKGRLLAA
jgi:hypothetical protein